jgi:hypothetical protein
LNSNETPLSGIPGFPAAYADALKRLWITTAEQLLGLASTPGGSASLSQELGIAPDKTQDLVEQARAALPHDLAASFSKPVDHHFPLGALPPFTEDDNKDIK